MKFWDNVRLIYVSIPHRYAKTFSGVSTTTANSLVSIPHRYAKNTASRFQKGMSVDVSILIGTLKTLSN